MTITKILFNKNSVALIFILLLMSCSTFSGFLKKNQTFHIATVNNNVCKQLQGDVVLYAVFVDSRYTSPWTEYDIFSTIDSIKVAMSWIEQQASNAGIPLNITLDFHQDEDQIIPIEANLTRKTLSATLLSVNGLRSVDKWADKIGKQALKIYGPDTSTVTRTKIKPKDRERLIARVRDEHHTDNVVLIYFINNYYTDEISATLHTASDIDPEYSIVSFKHPTVIAHEFLHIFGALDLYITPFDKKKKAVRKKAFAMKEFPNEIMAFSYRDLDSLKLSPFTKYLIGWDNELDQEYKQMLIGKKIKIARY